MTRASSPAERAARGREARKAVPRRSHAGFQVYPSRPDPVQLLDSQAADRVPELVPIRYGRMSVSPFTFYRGAALVMANDLATTPVSGLHVQLCGDAHLANFGGFASPERRLVFDLNDFDETLPGPWEWDVKRLAASLEIAARDNGHADAERRRTVVATVRAYRLAMRQFADITNLDVWYAYSDTTTIERQVRGQLDAADKNRLSRNLAKARTRDNLQALERLTTVVDGELRFVSDPPLVEPIDDIVSDAAERHRLSDALRDLLRDYRTTLQSDRRTLLEGYRPADMARKVVGVGSVGTRCWIILMFGRDERDPLILQAKEAGPSVLEDFLPRSEYHNCGHRVVAGQRMMQAVSDIFLGWQRVEGIDGRTRDFYVRQLRDWKVSADLDGMGPAAMQVYGQLCGWTLARAHARSGDRIAIAAYLGSADTFDRAIGEFAVAYADQNERDHAALLEAIKTGRITAELGL
jgi:uncharacterized protein (DUF2252 family)